MAKRLTEEDKALIRKVYAECGTYAETARRTGFSASSVSKYAKEEVAVKLPEIDLGPINIEFPSFCENGFIVNLNISEDEMKELKELQKEVLY